MECQEKGKGEGLVTLLAWARNLILLLLIETGNVGGVSDLGEDEKVSFRDFERQICVRISRQR